VYNININDVNNATNIITVQNNEVYYSTSC